ncbi:MAG: histidine phosphatase family protein [Candidatus Bathyarchaeota archaeon]|nr:histidine phosphatase family protein [Candidatus Bathyarchaeota archaeon]
MIDMICKLFVFRHAETTDNARSLFSGWRDPKLTAKGVLQAEEVAEQLSRHRIDYAFTSHLRRARETLGIVLRKHNAVPVFVDDRLIERCYGTLQGKSKHKLSVENPEWFARIHRGYDYPPPDGESLKMVESRTLPFIVQLEQWLRRNPGNVAISCHGNSLRPIRRVFEHLSLEEMLRIENPQDHAVSYALNIHNIRLKSCLEKEQTADWKGIVVPPDVKLATDFRNPLKKYYLQDI